MPSYADIRSALAAQLDVFVAGIEQLDPAGRTDCAGWTVADLDNHMANNLKGLAAVAERKVDERADGGVAFWSDQLEAFAPTADGIARGGRLRTKDFVQPALEALDTYPEDTVVHQATGNHSLADAAIFRLIEGVVHGLDVGIEPQPAALRLVVKELTKAFAAKHPGRSVELRVPPYSAVQCLEGPRHTRGTPPNVVEAQPVAWVRVAAGREAWTDLVRTGRITASGERSDLSPLLPLVR
ncbi:MAG: hypothetical protein JWO12_3151 [Frankiales bacterium]|nr:hypothetical protein [Frankiales bacterium]